MKRSGLSMMILVICAASCGAAESAYREIPMSEVETAFEQAVSGHPRLFMNDGDVRRIKQQIESDTAMQVFYRAMLDKADGLMDRSPVKRVVTGRRLLGVSRECLDRVIHLAAAYRFTGKKTYLERAEREMLAAAGFSDWHPSHFLDVAEMTAAMAIGYDWLYDDLSEASRETIRKAILEKGLNPSLKTHGWARGQNNWNQVCNGGMVLGALAIMEDEPKLAREMVHRAVNGVQVVMKHYEPDGAYPEGPGYWVYGTSYNVVMFSALESVLGTDFGLSKAPGFSRCAEYLLHVTGPTGQYFNYPDSGSRSGFCPAVFWFAKKYDRPEVAWYQHQIWEKAMKGDASSLVSSRLAPLVLAWCDSRKVEPKQLNWQARGDNCVAMFRSSWSDPDAVYLAIKGGSPGVSHGHMDVGSFVLDAKGVRWAVDLGPENYNKIESLGMNLWGRGQNDQRWTIFRYNNLSHNTLVVNGQYQQVKGHAPILEPSESHKKPFPYAAFDMSSVYEGQLSAAVRGAALLDNGYVLIQDTFEAADKPITVRWAMVTAAEVVSADEKTAILKKDGKAMHLTASTNNKPVKWQTWSTEPKADYDAPNPGTRLVGFELSLPAGGWGHLAVYMIAYDKDDAPVADPPEELIWND